MISNDAPIFRNGAPLPGFRPASKAVLSALPALDPHARISVSTAASRRMINAGGHWTAFDNDVAPYMVEPQDSAMSRSHDSVVFAGPARCSKTESLVLNVWTHSVLAAPRLAAIFSATQGSAREFVVQDLEPMIRNSPELQDRLRFNNTHDKRFTGGARLTIDWPVPNKLAGRSIPLVILSDYDMMEQDIGGEGSPFALGRKRTTSAGSRGMTIAETSPRFPIVQVAWSPETPHEAPPVSAGILALYNRGSRGRWYWTCPDCSGEFEPNLDRLNVPESGSSTERGAATYMTCLHCGGIIEARHKAELNRSGRWLHESADGGVVPLGDGVRKTSTLSYWLHGPAAALATWATIVTRYCEAKETFERTGWEADLKTVHNVDLGLPYLPAALSAVESMSEIALRESATDHEWRCAPAGTRFLIAAVDVQLTRFVVQVTAFLANMERVIINRFDIIDPPAGAPRAGDRAINPARYGEDWNALLTLFDEVYPVANADHGLKVLGVICDAQGAAGVTPNAYAFYRKVKTSHPRRFHLQRGRGGLDRPRVEVKAPESSRRGRKYAARDVLIVNTGTDVLKDEVAASLVRGDKGSRAIHVPRAAPPETFAELASEVRDAKGWSKRPGASKNEALDLCVYALALALSLDAERVNYARPPVWALEGPTNSFAVHLSPTLEGSAGHQTPKPVRRRTRKRGRGMRNFDGW